jgi:pilus assembly protein CpaB
MRAYTIQTSRIASNVAGFIMPGNKVDVLMNMKGSRGDSTGGGSTTTLLQAVEVLAVAQHLEAPADFKVDPLEMTSVTLHVTPQQANDLDLGQNMGVLTLALRNPEDEANVETCPATVSDVRFLAGQALNNLPEGMVDEPLPPQPATVGPKKQAPMWVVTLRGRNRGRVMLGDGQDY